MESPVFTKEQLLKQLEKFKKIKGKTVIVHTSLKAIGKIDGGGEALLDVLIEFFTQNNGLLCIPTHTWDSDIYDTNKSDSCIGVMARIAASDPRCVRTLHPTHSMAVFGNDKRVQEFIREETTVDSPTNPKGCYGKIIGDDGYVLLIGVGQDKNTIIHCVEEILGVKGRLTDYLVERTVIHKDGSREKRCLYWFDESICDVSDFFPKLEKPFRHMGCIEDGVIGNASTQMCSAKKIYETMEKIYKNNNFAELLHDDIPIDEKLYL